MRELPGAVERVMSEPRRYHLLKCIDKLKNRAVFEIPEILQRILMESVVKSNQERRAANALLA